MRALPISSDEKFVITPLTGQRRLIIKLGSLISLFGNLRIEKEVMVIIVGGIAAVHGFGGQAERLELGKNGELSKAAAGHFWSQMGEWDGLRISPALFLVVMGLSSVWGETEV